MSNQERGDDVIPEPGTSELEERLRELISESGVAPTDDEYEATRSALFGIARAEGLLMPRTDAEIEEYERRLGPAPSLESDFVARTTREVLRRIRGSQSTRRHPLR